MNSVAERERRSEMEPERSVRSLPKTRRRREVCLVERWRGYVNTSFYVRSADGTTYESPSFRWRRREPPPDEGAARAAYDTLVEQLRGDGWVEHERGDAWCETSFAHWLTQPASDEQAVPPPPDAEPSPEPAAEPPAPPPVAIRAAPTPAPVRARQPRTSRLWVTLGAALAGSAITATVLLLAHGPAPTVTHTITVESANPPTTTAAPAATAATSVEVVISAVRGTGSWVEARRNSASGRVLYSGVLEPGKKVRLRAPRVWARFGAAGNLAIRVDGKPVVLHGTYDKTFGPAQ